MNHEKIRKNWPILFMSQLLTTALWGTSSVSHAGEMNDLRGKRYCEIIIGKSPLTLEVYNTIGLNDCPNDLWRKINEKDIKAEKSARFVRLNGPRYWVISGLKNSSLLNKTPVEFNGIGMREAGVLHVSLWDIVHADKVYRDHVVHRKTTYVYNAGQPVYELITPTGQVYVMQSYSVQRKSLNEASLADLGKTLSLPKDWTFKTGVLTETHDLVASNQEATVLQDNLLNTYQKAPKDLLP